MPHLELQPVDRTRRPSQSQIKSWVAPFVICRSSKSWVAPFVGWHHLSNGIELQPVDRTRLPRQSQIKSWVAPFVDTPFVDQDFIVSSPVRNRKFPVQSPGPLKLIRSSPSSPSKKNVVFDSIRNFNSPLWPLSRVSIPLTLSSCGEMKEISTALSAESPSRCKSPSVRSTSTLPLKR